MPVTMPLQGTRGCVHAGPAAPLCPAPAPAPRSSMARQAGLPWTLTQPPRQRGLGRDGVLGRGWRPLKRNNRLLFPPCPPPALGSAPPAAHPANTVPTAEKNHSGELKPRMATLCARSRPSCGRDSQPARSADGQGPPVPSRPLRGLRAQATCPSRPGARPPAPCCPSAQHPPPSPWFECAHMCKAPIRCLHHEGSVHGTPGVGPGVGHRGEARRPSAGGSPVREGPPRGLTFRKPLAAWRACR